MWIVKGDGPTSKNVSDQNLKLDQKPVGKTKIQENIENIEDRTLSIKTRSSKLDEKLEKIKSDFEISGLFNMFQILLLQNS